MHRTDQIPSHIRARHIPSFAGTYQQSLQRVANYPRFADLSPPRFRFDGCQQRLRKL
jgi:hypothetical protein